MAARSSFVDRHLGPDPEEQQRMLGSLGLASLEELADAAMPAVIRAREPGEDLPARTEHEMLAELRRTMGHNRLMRSYLGGGYHGTVTPAVILRNILENPGWYTQYTPYQAEISQGRLELLLVFQTMISELCGLAVANASLLDEATAAAEAMAMAHRLRPRRSTAGVFLVAPDLHPQTLAVVRTRARARGLEVRLGRPEQADSSCFGVLVQLPGTFGALPDIEAAAAAAHQAGARLIVAADPLSLALLRAPGHAGADIVVGSTQRFGVPLGYGGPHAAFLAGREEDKRQIPGRIIGASVDRLGGRALRMAMQTREQHIRRSRATSNICTAQVLPALLAAAYGCYHGAEGLTRLAARIRGLTEALRDHLGRAGHEVPSGPLFDTLTVRPVGFTASEVLTRALERGINLRDPGDGRVALSLDETCSEADLLDLLAAFGETATAAEIAASKPAPLPAKLARRTSFMGAEPFTAHRSETEMLRWLQRLRSRDLSLADAMTPLGSCTMKLNAAAEMLPLSWPEVGGMHPFAPLDQAAGWLELIGRLEVQLARITGFAAVSLQPNAGSQGEYAGLLAIRAWHASRGDEGRDVCLIPASAHGTNAASSVMAGMRVVGVRCDAEGNIDLGDLRARAAEHADSLAALMVTYPSTHGVFEAAIREICAIVHEHGGQVYFDGANLNALVGHARPAELGADVGHINLHKTFAIPHGGGGPGVGPIGVAPHLVPFLPGHLHLEGSEQQRGGAQVAAAPFGSPAVLPIAWAYIEMMGSEGLRRATRVAILNANYVARRLDPYFPVLYRGPGGWVAHECIIDVRACKKSAGVSVDDIAKRLMDYGFHAPTMSFPVPGTLMIEPTESEPLAELDRFCEAMIAIHGEIARVEAGDWPRDDHPLSNAPHTALEVGGDEWPHAYPRSTAAWPVPSLREHKIWPAVARVDNTRGDRHLVCTCVGVQEAAALSAWQPTLPPSRAPRSGGLMKPAKPTARPHCPNFSSGPCAKRPGWSVQALSNALAGRSHRSVPGRARLREVIDRSRAVLAMPDDWRLGIVPASDTGAIEMVMWAMLGERGVDMLCWESFGKGWVTDARTQVGLEDLRVFEAGYGELPELDRVDFRRDVVLCWNGTTSGVRVPDGDWIVADREGLVLADSTSAAFAMELPWDKLDVVTWSWQKVLGGEAAHGMLALSPRAVARLESYDPGRPLPKIFRLLKGGRLNEAIFRGSTINTPSMLAVEDAIDGLKWAESVGGLPGLIARSRANLAAVARWVARTPWIDFLAADERIRSNTSVCLSFSNEEVTGRDIEGQKAFAARVAGLLDAEGVGYDLKHYRDAPPGLRIWCGGTVETEDVEALLPWIEWAYARALEEA